MICKCFLTYIHLNPTQIHIWECTLYTVKFAQLQEWSVLMRGKYAQQKGRAGAQSITSLWWQMYFTEFPYMQDLQIFGVGKAKRNSEAAHFCVQVKLNCCLCICCHLHLHTKEKKNTLLAKKH